ncbi:hypothetical protein [Streptomyces zhihengii]|uniref:hypothetical protein n=1 Tax=Streptomyces zhihengii TaxID=1818004 RepID=UPI0033A07845
MTTGGCVGVEPAAVREALEGVMPYLAPTGLAVRALAALNRPPPAWQEDPEFGGFDSAGHYAAYADEPGALSPLEKKIAQLPTRPTWRMERVWTPDEESDARYDAAYDKASVSLDGSRLHPRDLDAYCAIAYAIAGLDQGDDADGVDGGTVRACGDVDTALSWAAAGVCVLQQSLPYPFTDVLLWGEIDNRPAHRVLFAYATLLGLKDEKAAGPWFTALVYLNPMDNIGARFFTPGGPACDV